MAMAPSPLSREDSSFTALSLPPGEEGRPDGVAGAANCLATAAAATVLCRARRLILRSIFSSFARLLTRLLSTPSWYDHGNTLERSEFRESPSSPAGAAPPTYFVTSFFRTFANDGLRPEDPAAANAAALGASVVDDADPMLLLIVVVLRSSGLFDRVNRLTP